MSLRDERVLIVGGTSGIGFATAVLVAERGALVAVASRSARVLGGDPAAVAFGARPVADPRPTARSNASTAPCGVPGVSRVV